MKDSYRDITEIFKNDFSEVSFESATVDLEKGITHCIFTKIPNEKFLKDNWKSITNSVALNYQNYLATSFEKWNIYLFFLMSQTLEDMNLKYTIENNTFSSRKIVESASLSTENLIKKHINNLLTIDVDTKNTDTIDFSYDGMIYDVLKDKKIKKKNFLPAQLNLAYEELITKLREENEI